MRFFEAALVLAAVSPCFGRELIYLNSGFSLEVESHEQENQTITCHTSTGTLEFQLADGGRVERLPENAGPRVSVAAKTVAPSADELLVKAALEQGLPPELIRSVAKVESGVRQNAISPKGAIGLMQLMPQTAAELGIRPQEASDNARGGAMYLRELLLRYHGNAVLALAAYNAGPEAVAKFR